MQRLPKICLLALCGCWVTGADIDNKIAATDTAIQTATTTSTATSSTTTGTTSSTTTGQTDLMCVDLDLGSTVGDAAGTGTTDGAGDDITGDCFGGVPTGGQDFIYSWTAPNSGCFAFDSSESGFDTVLFVKRGCTGEEVACNDDASGEITTSHAGFEVVGGETYVVVVDGYDASKVGPFQLDIQPTTPVPQDRDLGSTTGIVTGNTSSADSTSHPALCEYNSGKDIFMRWTPPSTDTWTFSLTGATSFDSVLSVHRACSSNAAACSDVISDVTGGGESITMNLWVGEEVTIRVGGYLAGGTAAVPESGTWEMLISN